MTSDLLPNQKMNCGKELLMTDYTYTQYAKTVVRHQILLYAITLLTSNRENASCVNRSYVRNVYDFLTQTEDDNRNKEEALKIGREYILDWEKLHDACCGVKRPSDLVVCYLCGPEPNNDFDEMLSLGILPQNIWAFEDNKKTYQQALSVYENENYKQPRIIRQNIETFFTQTPKKFDIIYIDACGSIPSEQHALHCISTIFQYHRLESPGIIISNFAEPDDKEPYIELLTQYFHAKTYPETFINYPLNSPSNSTYQKLKRDISQSFETYYSDFISYILRDIPGIIIPIQRFWKNPYINQIIKNKNNRPITISSSEAIQHTKDSLAKFFITYDMMENHGFSDPKIKLFLQELGDYSTLTKAFKELQLLKSGTLDLVDNLESTYAYFENGKNLYQFLDKPHSNLLFDLIINQLAYPFHCSTGKELRFKYRAKSTPMYTDVTVYDECRYIYEWLPALHQIKTAFNNPAYQYVFRFALDGLVKSRELYNNEFFFQGSVIPNSTPGFSSKTINERKNLC